MLYLGSFDTDEDIILSVTWTPADVLDVVDASTVTVRHASSTDVVSAVGTKTATNTFQATIRLPRAGRWIVEWVTSPGGGRDVSTLYVQ